MSLRYSPPEGQSCSGNIKLHSGKLNFKLFLIIDTCKRGYLPLLVGIPVFMKELTQNGKTKFGCLFQTLYLILSFSISTLYNDRRLF